MVQKTSFRFRLRTLFLLPILITLPAAWWHQLLDDSRAEQELMNLLPHAAGVDFDRCGPKWIGWFAPSQMMRVVAVDVSGLSPRRGVYVNNPTNKLPFDDVAFIKLIPHLKRLKFLKWLALFDTSITDEGLIQLSALDNLDRLNLQGTQVSKEAVRELALANPQITITYDISPTLGGLKIHAGEAWRTSKSPKKSSNSVN